MKAYSYLQAVALLEGNKRMSGHLRFAFCSPSGVGATLQGEAAALYKRLLEQYTPSEN